MENTIVDHLELEIFRDAKDTHNPSYGGMDRQPEHLNSSGKYLK
jgi:hypothetical protein